MNTIGFLISRKEHEKRRVILPEDIVRLDRPDLVMVEEGYGNVLSIKDDQYREAGCQVGSFEDCLNQDIICDPKIGDEEYLEDIDQDKILFGWFHAAQNRPLTDLLLEKNAKAYAWEDMYEDGRHIFWENNMLAGYASCIHAALVNGQVLYGKKVAILGRGNTGLGALKAVVQLGANPFTYSHRKLDLFRKELPNYDIVINCLLWDSSRTDHVIYKKDLKRMKKGAMIIDVSCDEAGAIETCIPTSFEDPVYEVDGVLHYAVDHTPSIFYKTFTESCSKLIAPYVNQLIKGEPGPVLKESLAIADGKILSQEILDTQRRTQE